MYNSVRPNKTHSSKQRSIAFGFTLIELLIALTILGILMTMAIPVYFEHQARAQLTEAVTLGGAHRVNVEDYILNHGDFPPNDEVNRLIPHTEEIEGVVLNRYPTVESVVLQPSESQPRAGSIVITLSEQSENASTIRGATVEFRRTARGSWFCLSNVDEEFLPKGCRTSES